MHGRQITTEENLLNGSNVLTNDFLGSFDATTSAKDGFIIYKQMDTMISDYLVRLTKYEQDLQAVNKHNDKVKTNKMILIAAKLLFSSGPGALVGSPLLFPLIGKIPTIKPWYDGGNPSDEKVKKARADFAKAVDKSLWEVGELLFKESLTTKPNPTKPSQPTAAFSEMYFNGGITDSHILIVFPGE